MGWGRGELWDETDCGAEDEGKIVLLGLRIGLAFLSLVSFYSLAFEAFYMRDG